MKSSLTTALPISSPSPNNPLSQVTLGRATRPPPRLISPLLPILLSVLSRGGATSVRLSSLKAIPDVDAKANEVELESPQKEWARMGPPGRLVWAVRQGRGKWGEDGVAGGEGRG